MYIVSVDVFILGCGVGKICRILEFNSLFCDRCDFDRNFLICGFWRGSYVIIEFIIVLFGDCVLSEDVVFSGFNDIFIG